MLKKEGKIMKKLVKFLSLLLALVLALGALASCGGDDDAEETKKKKKKKDPAKTTVTVPETVDPNHDHLWGEWEVTREPTCAEEGISTRICDCGAREEAEIEKSEHTPGEWEVIKESTITEEGLKVIKCTECGEQIETLSLKLEPKWSYYADKAGYLSGSYSNDVIIDVTGEIVYTAEDGEDIKMYANGFFISEKGGVQYLKSANGRVICSTKSLDITGFGLVRNYVDYSRFFEDGYIFAYKFEETYSDSVCKIGILGTDGEWIVPLSEDNPIIKSGTKCTEKEFKDHFYYYLGCGVLALRVYEGEQDYVLYNIEDNALYEFTIDVSNFDYILKEKTSFNDGVSYSKSNSILYKITVKAEVETIRLPNEPKSDTYTDKNGDFYLVTESAILKNGEVHKELDYKVSSGAWIGENCLIIIKNPSGKSFFTYVTKDGEFLFDPVECSGAYVCDVSGIGAGSIYTDGEKLVVDESGNIYYTSKNDEAYIYVNNGVVMEEVRGAFSSDETFTAIDVK